MDRDRLKTLFFETLDCPEVELEGFLARIDQSEPALAAELRQLVNAHRTADGFLAEPAALIHDSHVSAERVEVHEVLGRGGMGTVFRATDLTLDRDVALKTLNLAGGSVDAVHRFLQEARVCARLQHPGIVPVYALGRLDDGRPYFTMRPVQGATLSKEIRTWWKTTASRSLPPRRLISWLARVCETLGYVHSQGVVHRDLKPDNVMIGSFGEVLVLDWGLASGPQGEPGSPDAGVTAGDDPNREYGGTAGQGETSRTVPGGGPNPSVRTPGSITGTPAYMPPELAWGASDEIDARTDVYSLGAMLYQILCGRPPYSGRSVDEVMVQVRSRAPEALLSSSVCPVELSELVSRAMARDREKRPENATVLADGLAGWLEGMRWHERATARVSEARDLNQRAAEFRAAAAQCASSADTLLRDVPSNAPVAAKATAWALQDRGEAATREAELALVQMEQTLHSALRDVPDFPEALTALADHHHEQHLLAEAEGDPDLALRHELALRAHQRGAYTAYLKGTGALSLASSPPGAKVEISRFETENRRRIVGSPEPLGQTPLNAHPLSMGSYLVTLKLPHRREVRYPVYITREHHWDGIRPGEQGITPIVIPKRLGANDRVVSAGWFIAGGDPLAPPALPRQRTWVDGFVVREFPVTNGEYIEFLHDLVDNGRVAEAEALAPHERGGRAEELGALVYAFDGSRFSLTEDSDGDLYLEDWPVIMVDWRAARAYAAWEAARTGLPWRLGASLEWEKAARGTDGRLFPWGNHHDPTWSHMHRSHKGRPNPVEIGTYPADVSVYGVRDMAGNARDWCLDEYDQAGHPQAVIADIPDPDLGAFDTQRVVRGGAWLDAVNNCRCAFRGGVAQYYRGANFSFRLFRSLVDADVG